MAKQKAEAAASVAGANGTATGAAPVLPANMANATFGNAANPPFLVPDDEDFEMDDEAHTEMVMQGMATVEAAADGFTKVLSKGAKRAKLSAERQKQAEEIEAKTKEMAAQMASLQATYAQVVGGTRTAGVATGVKRPGDVLEQPHGLPRPQQLQHTFVSPHTPRPGAAVPEGQKSISVFSQRQKKSILPEHTLATLRNMDQRPEPLLQAQTSTSYAWWKPICLAKTSPKR